MSTSFDGAGRARRSLVAGVDVGGTKVAALVVDETGEILGRAVRPMAGRSSAGVEPIVGAVRAALEAAGASTDDLAAIGVGVPGRVDVAAGVVGLATNLGWRDLPLARLLEDELGVACTVENDVGLAASGLAGHAIASGAKSLAYVAVGTGIGAGLVINGRLHRGDRGMAGEIGHIVVDPGGAVCRCGQRGCLETVAAGPFIARRATEALATAGSEIAGHPILAAGSITARSVYEAAAAGDLLALAITGEVGQTLARAVAGLMLTCDLDLVLLGGGVAAAGATFLDPILAELERVRAASPLVAAMIPAGSVRALPPSFDPVAWGGVALARSLVPAGEASKPRGDAEEVVARTTLA